jgi:hypothetical protein
VAPFYFANLIVDPTNPDRLFKPDLALIQSLDGGKTFANVGGGAHGDFHDVWIDPKDPQKVIAGDDGGLWLSKDGGNRWWKANNLPISQFYHVSVDNDDPYHVYGGLQDNSSWVGDSSYPAASPTRAGRTCTAATVLDVPDPSDHDFIYAEAQGGTIGRVNRVTHEYRDIQPRAQLQGKAALELEHADRAVADRQEHPVHRCAVPVPHARPRPDWDRISPDLTTNDPQKQLQEQSGGITVDNSAAEMHTTIYAISESPKDHDVDLGRHRRRQRAGHARWRQVVEERHRGAGVPANSWVSYIDAGRFDAGTAYVAFDRHTFGDMAPMLYKTTDYGAHWQALANASQPKGIQGYAHVLREDPVAAACCSRARNSACGSRPTTARLGAVQGRRFPGRRGARPVVQPRDGDLVLATHGRGIWIIDDLTPLRALKPELLQQEAVFLPTRPQQQRISTSGLAEGDASYAGTNASTDVTITYYPARAASVRPAQARGAGRPGHVLDTLRPASVAGSTACRGDERQAAAGARPAASIAGSSTQGPRVPRERTRCA